MGQVKFMERNVLTEAINKKQGVLAEDLFMVTNVRATKNNGLQIEVCQNRNLSGGADSMLALLNLDDDRFSTNSTLLFDWIKLMPKNFKAMFPEVELTLEDLEEIADSYDPNGPTGANAMVVPVLDQINKAIHPKSGKELTPVIIVSEYTESELDGTFFQGEDSADKAADVIKRGRAVMRTSSAADAEYIVHPVSGEKIYRFTRTFFKEDGKTDTLIEGKTTESKYKAKKAQFDAKGAGRSALKSNILGGDSI